MGGGQAEELIGKRLIASAKNVSQTRNCHGRGKDKAWGREVFNYSYTATGNQLGPVLEWGERERLLMVSFYVKMDKKTTAWGARLWPVEEREKSTNSKKKAGYLLGGRKQTHTKSIFAGRRRGNPPAIFRTSRNPPPRPWNEGKEPRGSGGCPGSFPL